MEPARSPHDGTIPASVGPHPPAHPVASPLPLHNPQLLPHPPLCQRPRRRGQTQAHRQTPQCPREAKRSGLCRGGVAEPGGRRGRCPGSPTRSGAGCCRRPRRPAGPEPARPRPDVADGRGAWTGRRGCDTRRLFRLLTARPPAPHGTVSGIPGGQSLSRDKGRGCGRTSAEVLLLVHGLTHRKLTKGHSVT